MVPVDADVSIDAGGQVENPDLCAAVREFVASRSPLTEQELARQLRRATFLVPTHADGTRIACVDDDQTQHLPLFTDQAALRAWANEDLTTRVVPAAEAWDAVLSGAEYAAAVVNPGSGQHTLPLSREAVAQLRGSTGPAGAADVARAIERFSREPTEPNRVELYVTMQRSMLLVAAVGVPKEWVDAGPRTVDANTPVQLLTATTQEGGTVLVAFTSVTEAQKRKTGMPCFAMRALDILRLTVDGGHVGLVVDPAGEWMFVPRLDAEVVLADAASRETT